MNMFVYKYVWHWDIHDSRLVKAGNKIRLVRKLILPDIVLVTNRV